MSVMHYFFKKTPAARRQKVRRCVGARASDTPEKTGGRGGGDRGVFLLFSPVAPD
jgi:hypothetical protein